MTFRERVESLDSFRWEIPLATHFGSNIPNQTSAPRLQLSKSRKMVEANYDRRWKTIRPPIAGYNCFGQVFAMRRTGIYDDENRGLVGLILSEDGFREIVNESDYAEGDVVLYSDERGFLHASRIVSFTKIQTAIGFGGPASDKRIPMVLSKFDDVSGEYEHPIGDMAWTTLEVSSQRVFRDRDRDPVEPAGWRQRLSALER